MLNERKQKRVLVDVGANGFLASPKYLLDSYAVCAIYLYWLLEYVMLVRLL